MLRIGLQVAQHDNVVLAVDTSVVCAETAIALGKKDVRQQVHILRAAWRIDQHVDQREGECLVRRRAADTKLGRQRTGTERARRSLDRMHRRMIDFHRRGVEEHGVVDRVGVFVQRRAGDEIVGAAGGVDQVLQPQQHAVIGGMEVLQSDHIEPRKDADEGLADFGVGQAVVVESVEIERGDSDRRLKRRGGRLVGRYRRAAIRPWPRGARCGRIGSGRRRCDGPPANSGRRHTNRPRRARRPSLLGGSVP